MSIVHTTATHFFSDLNQTVCENSEQISYLGRVWKTLQIVKREKGFATAVAASVGLVAASAYTATFSYFCLEGSARSLEETYHSLQKDGRFVQAIGDAGGWTALPVFSLLGLNTIFQQFMREGEFIEVQEICKTWYENHREVSVDQFYSEIIHILDTLSPQCMIYKNGIYRRLIALKIIEELGVFVGSASSELFLDKNLQSTYKDIEKLRQETASSRRYLFRLFSGLRVSYAQTGTRGVILDIISGIALPILLNITSVWSIIGEKYLGDKVLVRKEDLPERGHFGEWPDNMVGASLVAYFLNRDLLLKGDLHLLKNIYRKSLKKLSKNPSLYNRLCEVANEDIQQRVSTISFRRFLQFNEFRPMSQDSIL
jgi:hypothetical protein